MGRYRMRYEWKPYCRKDASLVDSWLDKLAVQETGLEDGWQNFYDYWMMESETNKGKDCCFLISQNSVPFAAIYLAIIGSTITISEFLVKPDMRGKGVGTAALRELLESTAQLLKLRADYAKAVILPSNIASIKAFEKAGFVLTAKRQDTFGCSLDYEYRFPTD